MLSRLGFHTINFFNLLPLKDRLMNDVFKDRFVSDDHFAIKSR